MSYRDSYERGRAHAIAACKQDRDTFDEASMYDSGGDWEYAELLEDAKELQERYTPEYLARMRTNEIQGAHARLTVKHEEARNSWWWNGNEAEDTLTDVVQRVESYMTERGIRPRQGAQDIGQRL